MDTELIGKRAHSVRERIRRACERAGRDPADVTLVAVTKTFPVDTIFSAREAGLRDIGENKAQEFAEKVEAVASQTTDLTWHFIGHLQRNKVKFVAGRAHMIHGVDSLRLANALQKFADKENLSLDCLVQINVSGESSKFGLDPESLPEILRQIRSLDRISFRGLMTLASPTDDERRLRDEFGLLRRCLSESKNVINTMRYLSMGMSSDFEIAVEEGATHVRLGSALFGDRNA